MGAVKAEAVMIDHIDSHARLRGGEVEVVLRGLEGAAGATALELSREEEILTAPLEAGTAEVRALVPRSSLSDGQWSIAIAGTPVAARLLVQGARPLVLLPGAQAPRSVVPRGKQTATPPSFARRAVRKLARTVRR
jgi:hypothetical protein